MPGGVGGKAREGLPIPTFPNKEKYALGAPCYVIIFLLPLVEPSQNIIANFCN